MRTGRDKEINDEIAKLYEELTAAAGAYAECQAADTAARATLYESVEWKRTLETGRAENEARDAARTIKNKIEKLATEAVRDGGPRNYVGGKVRVVVDEIIEIGNYDAALDWALRNTPRLLRLDSTAYIDYYRHFGNRHAYCDPMPGRAEEVYDVDIRLPRGAKK